MNQRLALVPLVVLALGLASCGSSSSDGAVSADQSTTAAGASAGTKPVVKVPSGAKPTKVITKDLKVGTGAEAVPGKPVTVQYVGVAWSTGKEFDSSWDRGQPFTFNLGAGEVIAGWDEGVAGMKVGGRREIIIPPDKGYGPQGAGADIGPDETLIFVVDLVSVG